MLCILMAKRMRMPLPAINVLLAVLVGLLTLLLLRRRSQTGISHSNELLAELPGLLARLDAATAARLETLDASTRLAMEGLRADFSQLRREAAHDAEQSREASRMGAKALREEVLVVLSQLGQTVNLQMAEFRTHSADVAGAQRTESVASAEALRLAVRQDLEGIRSRLSQFFMEASRTQVESREALHARLHELSASQQGHQDRLRATVEQRLDLLNSTNAGKLEEMRATVGEKLHATLHSRLTESFGQVTEQLSRVHSGLGEMSKLSEGVEGLSRIFTNVKSRGGFAEVQLGMLLEQMLAPSQYLRNARVRAGTQEVVEFAVRFPGHSGEMLLPIDAKFPREDFERLEAAYEAGSPEEIAATGRAFETAIRIEGRRICEKYIEPPLTTPYAIMFLPTEGLYAEVMRREGLQAELQSKCRVTIAGPSTLSAILSSFQMGFHMLAIQQKGDEVWKVLQQTRTEFTKFEDLMSSMEKQVGTVQNTIQKLGTRTRAINRTLRDVGEVEGSGSEAVLAFPSGLVPARLGQLAAAANDDGS